MQHRLVWINSIFFIMTFSVGAQSLPRCRSQGKLPNAQSSAPQPICSAAVSAVQAKTRATRGVGIFVFHTDEFWLNLHHFLYVLGRAENKDPLASREAVIEAPNDQQQGLEKLSSKEQRTWREAVASYALGVSRKDLVFDDPLPALTNTLARARDAKSLTGFEIDPTVAGILERAAPVYRKAWWKKHHDANRNWQKAIQALVNRLGEAVLAFITNAYKLQWPAAGFPVHVCAYSNWAGAYSTTGDLLVLSSLSPGNQGSYGLEIVFHEGMHQWDKEIFAALREQAIKVSKVLPRSLSHSLIFFTAGEAVRRAVPEHVPYAQKFGVWQRGLGPMKIALEEIWKPYLNGHGTREEAFAELVKRTASEPPRK